MKFFTALLLISGVSFYSVSATNFSLMHLDERAGTVDPDERAGTVDPDERAGTVDPDERAGTVDPDERAGTVDPDERIFRFSF